MYSVYNILSKIEHNEICIFNKTKYFVSIKHVRSVQYSLTERNVTLTLVVDSFGFSSLYFKHIFAMNQ